MKRRAAIAAAVALLAAAAGWLLWSAAPGHEAPEASPGPSQTREPLAAPAIAERAEQGPAVQSSDGGARPTVRITVISALDGKPLAGAEAWVGQRYWHGPSTAAEGVTGADGVAVLEVGRPIAAGEKASARKDFFDTQSQPFVDGMTLALELLPPLRGKVIDLGGRPVARARVSTTREKAVALTDGEGRFTLALPGIDWIYAEKDGVWGQGEWVKDKASEVVITLASTDVPRRVVDTAGKPIASVRIRYRLAALETDIESDAEGVWKLPRFDARAIVTFVKAGYARHERAIMLTKPATNVVLIRTSRLEGVVVEPDGRAIGGAEVTLEPTSDELISQKSPRKTTAGPDGRFAFEDLEALTVTLEATIGERDAQLEVDVPEGGTGQARIVVPPLTTNVPLLVVDARDEPVPEFSYDATATPIPDQGWETTGSGGIIPLAKGRYRIDVQTDYGQRGHLEVDVDPAEDMPPIKVKVTGGVWSGGEEDEEPAPTYTLKVRVRGPTGVPVGGATVQCLGSSGVTREDGVFERQLSPAEDDWPIQVKAWKGTETGMTRATGQEAEVEVVLRGARVVRGRIEGEVPKGRCMLVYNSPTDVEEWPQEGNTFSLEGLGAARGFLCLRCRGALDSDPEAVRGCSVVEAAPTEVVVPTGATGTLALKVIDAAGQPVEQPILYIDRHGTSPVAPGGEARVQVPPGSHVLVINVGGRRERAELSFTIRSNETSALGTVQLK